MSKAAGEDMRRLIVELSSVISDISDEDADLAALATLLLQNQNKIAERYSELFTDIDYFVDDLPYFVC